MNRKKAMFFVPHADDLEIGAGLLCVSALKSDYDVIELLMSGCEYGTGRHEFRGKRLRRIRMAEVERAARVFEQETGGSIDIKKLLYPDGFLPFNEGVISQAKEIILSEQPDIIFAPDPFYSMDYHRDHIQTGLIAYFALRSIKSPEIPNMIYFYYSFKTNMGIPCELSDIDIIRKAISNYRSQISPFDAGRLRFLLKLILKHSLHKHSSKYAKRVRACNVKKSVSDEHPSLRGLREKLKYLFYMKFGTPARKMYAPTPKELDLTE